MINTENKQIRNLEVYSQGQGNKWNIPTIILKGEWLEEMGFECGDCIEVRCENCKLTIYNLDIETD